MKKPKTRMTGALLRAFAGGIISDDDARKQGYDPIAVRKYHKIEKSKKQLKKPAGPILTPGHQQLKGAK